MSTPVEICGCDESLHLRSLLSRALRDSDDRSERGSDSLSDGLLEEIRAAMAALSPSPEAPPAAQLIVANLTQAAGLLSTVQGLLSYDPAAVGEARTAGHLGDQVRELRRAVASTFPERAPSRCLRTGNPCGTDTWSVGHSCPCAPCTAWLKRHEPAPPAEEKAGADRCEVCGWPLKATMEDGCTPGNCSYRPRAGTPEYDRTRARREELRKRAAPSSEGAADHRCPGCGFVMCEEFDERRINNVATLATPNGKYVCRSGRCQAPSEKEGV